MLFGLISPLVVDVLQAGRRPGIIFQSRELPGVCLPTVLVVPLTTQQAALRFPGTVLISPDIGNGLRQPSVALVFQLTAVDLNFVGTPVGNVSTAAISLLMQALDELFGH